MARVYADDFYKIVVERNNLEDTRELNNCFRMLTSIECYGGLLEDVDRQFENRYLVRYKGIDRKVRETLMNEIRLHSHIEYGVHTDSEGLTYNSISFDLD